MNLRLFISFSILVLLTSSFSCSTNASRSRKPVVQIKVESLNKKIISGDDISVSLTVKLKDGELKETRLFVDSALVMTSKDPEFSYSLKKFESILSQPHTIYNSYWQTYA